MRHKRHKNSLGLVTAHRKALLNNMAINLIKHKRIKTTFKKAKATSQFVDKLITLAKRKDLHAQRQLYTYLKSRDLVKYMVDEIGPLFTDRTGGYTRVIKYKNRKGDNALEAILELTEMPLVEEKVKETTSVKPAEIVDKKDETEGDVVEKTSKKAGFFTNLRSYLKK